MKPKWKWWLKSDPQNERWGPFASEDDAWRYLFGRDSDEIEREAHEHGGWHAEATNRHGRPSDSA